MTEARRQDREEPMDPGRQADQDPSPATTDVDRPPREGDAATDAPEMSPEAESDMSFPASDPPSYSQPAVGHGDSGDAAAR